MSEMEMAIEALKKCVGTEAYAKAMEEVKGGNAPAVEQERPVRVKETIELTAKKLIRDIGIPTSIKGYRYAVTAILLLVKEPDMADGITKVLYPAVAKLHDTTASRVERAIRHGVEVAWSRCDIDVLTKYFSNTVSLNKGKPTNSEFLTRIAEAVHEAMAE